MFRNILIPVDMTHPEKAPEMIKIAKKMGDDDTHYVLANIVHGISAMAELSIPQEYFDRAKEEAAKVLKAIASDNELDASIVLRTGQPATEILTLQSGQKIDLVIIGSHRPGLQDYFLGSTASRVVRHAQCPVLVMR